MSVPCFLKVHLLKAVTCSLFSNDTVLYCYWGVLFIVLHLKYRRGILAIYDLSVCLFVFKDAVLLYLQMYILEVLMEYMKMCTLPYIIAIMILHFRYVLVKRTYNKLTIL